MRTLKLEQVVNPEWDNYSNPSDPNRWLYKVVKVTNSTVPHVFDHLVYLEADSYCEAEDWEVTIS